MMIFPHLTDHIEVNETKHEHPKHQAQVFGAHRNLSI